MLTCARYSFGLLRTAKNPHSGGQRFRMALHASYSVTVVFLKNAHPRIPGAGIVSGRGLLYIQHPLHRHVQRRAIVGEVDVFAGYAAAADDAHFWP